MFSGKSGGTVLTSYVKSGALVNRKFHEFLVPTFLMSMSSQLGVVSDGIIVSCLLDAWVMVSVGASMPLNQIAAALSVMISVGAVGHITTALGVGEKEKASKIFSTVCILSLGIGILLTVFLFTFSAEISALISPAPSMTQGFFVFIQYFGLGLEGAALATVLSDIIGIAYLKYIYIAAFILGANDSAYPILGVLYGEKDYRSIRMFMKHIFRFMLIIVGFFALLSFIFPQEFLTLFRLSGDLAA